MKIEKSDAYELYTEKGGYLGRLTIEQLKDLRDELNKMEL